MQELLKVLEIFGGAIGDRSLEMVPDKLIGVEFGSVAWKAIGMQAWMGPEKLLDHGPLMGLAAIPQKDHGAAQVSKQMAEKLGHLRGADVLVRVKTGIEGYTSSVWGDSDGREAEILVHLPAQRR